MGFNLAKKLEDVYLTNAGISTTDPEADKGKIPELAKGIATVMDDYIKSLDLNITSLDAVVQLDEIVIKKPLDVNITTLGTVTGLTTAPGGGPVTGVGKPVGAKAKTLPNAKLTKKDFTIKGRAYLGKKAKEEVKLTDQKYDRTAERNLRHGTVSLDPNTRNI
jgi:hypothetical protein|tara:strand:- start:3940 stop:4428 length:489 start_codon:yes stop_codon:yes gene_type:complete